MISLVKFKKTIWDYYRLHGRKLAWRRTRNPYRILVSEIMLQQTQVARVESFYEKFIKKFPDFRSLSRAKTADVLRIWQGLGYNRRALALQKLAKVIIKDHGGCLPRDRAVLESLPGVGPYTAGAIRAFAFGEPEIFVETNIRRVFIHFFFPRAKKITDKMIVSYLERSSEIGDNREWYYALMDYGAMLGVTMKKNPNIRSAHYAKQSKFFGSDRELRGKILRLLLSQKKITLEEISKTISAPQRRIRSVITALVREGFATEKNNLLRCS
jgi:A/G-specific adenine glycosylase